MRSTVVLAVGAALSLPAAASAQSWKTVTMSRQIEGTSPLRVAVEYGAGRLTLGPTDDDGLLYRMHLRYDEDAFDPVAELNGDRLRLGVESTGHHMSIGRKDGGALDLELARGIPMDLDLEFGAVRADLDLGGLALTRLDLSTGASESTVDVSEPNPSPMARAHLEVGAAQFTARHLGNLNAERISVDAGVGEVTLWLNGVWRRDASLSVDMGLGALELRVPEGLGIQLRKDSFFTSLDSEGLVKHGDGYYSLDWDTAERKVTIDLDAAFGTVKVVWIR